MKDDQIVRVTSALALAVVYVGHVGLNGSGPVESGIIGTVSPFVLVVLAELTLAFPELLDRLPFGPTRAKKDSGQ